MNKKERTKFSKKIVVLCVALVVAFTPMFLYAFLKVGSEPTVLQTLFFGFVTAELFNLASLKKDENKKEKDNEKWGE